MYGLFFKLELNKVLRCRKYVSSISKRLMHALFFSYEFDSTKSLDTDLILLDTCNLKGRKDYTDYIDNFKAVCINQRSLGIFTVKYKFMPAHLLSKLYFIFNNFKSNYSLIDLLQLSQLYQLFLFLNKLDINNKKVVTFCDAHPEDNLIAQFFKKERYCTTYTLQHGYYLAAPGSINQEVYRNFVSDFMLCWGESSKINLIANGVSKDRLLVFGCFKKTINLPKTGHKKRNVFILLNGSHSSESNSYLINLSLDIVTKTSFNVLIKKHPDDKSNYVVPHGVTFVDELAEGLLKSEVAILTESGVFIDLYLAKFPFFILRTPLIKPEYLTIPNVITNSGLLSLLSNGSLKFKHIQINSLINEHIDFSVI